MRAPVYVRRVELDVEYARSFFPALRTGWALFDNAGGVVPPHTVVDRIAEYGRTVQVQLGATHELSARATDLVAKGREAVAQLLGADPDEIVLGPSTTMNVYVLAQALRPRLSRGDAVVVTNLDHEANVGAWRRLSEHGIEIREWRLRPETASLHVEDLDPLLDHRTRLVAFTHCSNLVGEIVDVPAVVRRARAVGALVCVDGVAYAPHRRLDVRALDVDFYLVSLYKVFGPHSAALYARRERLLELASQNHFFIGDDAIPYKLTPGNVNHELVASLPGIVEYLDALHERHWPAVAGSLAARLDRTFDLMARHEEALARPLLEWLGTRPGVRVLGPPTADPDRRTCIVSFVVEGRRSDEIVRVTDAKGVAIRWGDFYARRAIEALSLGHAGGVVRVSMVHYNTPAEVKRLIEALDVALGE